MIPSGYAEDIVYSEIPLDGSGDLQLTRASNGTRVNSAGLVEVCPWNLFNNSEEFDNASWTKTNASVSANSTTAPNGTTTADTIIPNSTNSYHPIVQSRTVVSGTQYTFSIYVKSAGYDFLLVNTASGSSSGNVGPLFNLSTGTLIGSLGGNNYGATIQSVGNGWYRIEFSYVTNATSSAIDINTLPTSSIATYSGNGTSGVYLWGAQLNEGALKPYFPTTDRLNVPRLTYQNGGGGCPSLLLEKQSTNLALYSEQFDNAAWTKAAVSVTANNITSPDGTQDADLFTTTSASICGAYQLISTSSGTFSFSLFAKKGNNNYLALNAQSSSADNCTAIFDLSDGTLGEYQTKGTTAYVSHKIENFGNDWYRCTIVLTTTTSVYFFPMFAPLKTGNTFNPSGEVNVASGKTLYLWGAQLEASTYPTSYIPTTTASATRVADFASVNLPNTNMTFCAYLECDEAPLGTTAGPWLTIENNSSNLGRGYGYSNTFGFAGDYALGVTSASKMVWKQESGTTAKLFKNGALAATSTTGTYSNPFNRFKIDGAYLDKPLKIKEFVFFDNNLTDAECAALTA